MHLAVEAVGNKFGGGATVLNEFIKAAIADARIDRVSVFCSPSKSRRFVFPQSKKIQVLPRVLAERRIAARMIWYESLLERSAKKTGADVVLCINGMGIIRSRPQVTFMQQSLPFSSEALATLNARGRLRMKVMRAMMGRSCRNASRVITQTETMASWVGEAFDLPDHKVRAIMPTICVDDEVRMSPGLAQRIGCVPRGMRLLYVGNTGAYKQLPVLIRGFGLVREQVDGATLFLAGPEATRVGRSGGVEYLEFVPHRRITSVYESMDALIFPALVESCSMPLLESMHSGLPVLAADRPYAREIGGAAILYYDPHSPRDLAAKIKRLLEDDALCRDLSDKGKERYREIENAEPYRRMIDAVVEYV